MLNGYGYGIEAMLNVYPGRTGLLMWGMDEKHPWNKDTINWMVYAITTQYQPTDVTWNIIFPNLIFQDPPRTKKLLQYSLQQPKAWNSVLTTIRSLCSMNVARPLESAWLKHITAQIQRGTCRSEYLNIDCN